MFYCFLVWSLVFSLFTADFKKLLIKKEGNRFYLIHVLTSVDDQKTDCSII